MTAEAGLMKTFVFFPESPAAAVQPAGWKVKDS